MSLIVGAAAIGGIAASNFIFNYTKNQYEVAISKLEELVNQLDGHLSNLRELRANVPGFWDDDDGKEACNALDKTINRIVLEMDHAKALIRVYKEAVAEFDTSKNTVGNLLKDALGILDGIGD